MGYEGAVIMADPAALLQMVPAVSIALAIIAAMLGLAAGVGAGSRPRLCGSKGGEDAAVGRVVWLALLLPNAVMHAIGGILLTSAPQYVISAGQGGAAGAGLVAGSFGCGLVLANVLAVKLCKSCGPKAMCLASAAVGGLGVLPAALVQVPGLMLPGLVTAAVLFGLAQSTSVVARTVYQAEAVKEGQGFISGWVSASNILGVATGALLSGCVPQRHFIAQSIICGTGFLIYGLFIMAFMPGGGARSEGGKLASPPEAGGAESPDSGSRPWWSSTFLKVCFLISSMGIAREAQKFLIPVVGAEQHMEPAMVSYVAFMSQILSMVAAPFGGFLMECIGVLSLIIVSLLTSAVGIQMLCLTGFHYYVYGASILGVGCGLSTGAAIALSIIHAPEDKKASFINGCRLCDSCADILVPLLFGGLSSSLTVAAVGSSLTLATLSSVCVALFVFSELLRAPSVKVPSMDFVVPLKAVGAFTRTVLEGIHRHYGPRRIYMICTEETREAVSRLMADWNLPRGLVSFVDEDAYFSKAFGFAKEELRGSFSATGPRDFGWWWQQLLKLGAGECIEGISENYCVWDADLIAIEPWPLAKGAGEGARHYVAPLQEKFLSPAHQQAYESSVRHILGATKHLHGLRHEAL